MIQVFNVTAFRELFPEFANPNTYPDTLLQNYWDMATEYINANDGIVLNGSTLTFSINLLTAHLVKSFTLINAGQNTVVVSGSAEGTVNVTIVPPPVKSAWQWWLSTTPYGTQLRGFLMLKAAGGFSVGGSLERASFRKANGVW